MYFVLQRKTLLHLTLSVGALLMVPFLAMQFSDEVVWTLGDFVVAASLLMGAGLAFLYLLDKSGTIVYHLAAGVAVFTTLLLIWMNLAVGLIGSESHPANLMYLGVVAVGLAGMHRARFQPSPMAVTLFSMAILQFLIALIALLFGFHQHPSSSLREIVNFNGFFVVLFAISGLLFRCAVEKPTLTVH